MTDDNPRNTGKPTDGFSPQADGRSPAFLVALFGETNVATSPKNDTKRCTCKALDIIAAQADVDAIVMVVIGISKDLVRTHDSSSISTA